MKAHTAMGRVAVMLSMGLLICTFSGTECRTVAVSTWAFRKPWAILSCLYLAYWNVFLLSGAMNCIASIGGGNMLIEPQSFYNRLASQLCAVCCGQSFFEMLHVIPFNGSLGQ